MTRGANRRVRLRRRGCRETQDDRQAKKNQVNGHASKDERTQQR